MDFKKEMDLDDLINIINELKQNYVFHQDNEISQCDASTVVYLIKVLMNFIIVMHLVSMKLIKNVLFSVKKSSLIVFIMINDFINVDLCQTV